MVSEWESIWTMQKYCSLYYHFILVTSLFEFKSEKETTIKLENPTFSSVSLFLNDFISLYKWSWICSLKCCSLLSWELTVLLTNWMYWNKKMYFPYKTLRNITDICVSSWFDYCNLLYTTLNHSCMIKCTWSKCSHDNTTQHI